jgi:leucyl-tRNA synthetase
VRESAEAIAIALSMFAPYTAEDMWERLGHEPSVALVRWPKADHTLLVEESVTAIVQVNGKVRERLEVPPAIGGDELEKLAMESPAVVRALEGKTVVNVVVRAPKVVSIQVAD